MSAGTHAASDGPVRCSRLCSMLVGGCESWDDAKAEETFNGLSFSGKERLVLPVERVKIAETRRRIQKAFAMLREGRV
jgi:hypothetical protein